MEGAKSLQLLLLLGHMFRSHHHKIISDKGWNLEL
jgi:hypothetical protein